MDNIQNQLNQFIEEQNEINKKNREKIEELNQKLEEKNRIINISGLGDNSFKADKNMEDKIINLETKALLEEKLKKMGELYDAKFKEAKELENEARKKLKSGDKIGAKRCLVKKKKLLQITENLNNQMMIMDDQLIALDNAANIGAIMTTIKNANNALKNNQVSVEELQDEGGKAETITTKEVISEKSSRKGRKGGEGSGAEIKKVTKTEITTDSSGENGGKSRTRIKKETSSITTTTKTVTKTSSEEKPVEGATVVKKFRSMRRMKK